MHWCDAYSAFKLCESRTVHLEAAPTAFLYLHRPRQYRRLETTASLLDCRSWTEITLKHLQSPAKQRWASGIFFFISLWTCEIANTFTICSEGTWMSYEYWTSGDTSNLPALCILCPSSTTSHALVDLLSPPLSSGCSDEQDQVIHAVSLAEDLQSKSHGPTLLKLCLVLGFLLFHEVVSTYVHSALTSAGFVEPRDLQPVLWISCGLFFMLLLCAGVSCLTAMRMTVGYATCMVLYLAIMFVLECWQEQAALNMREISEYDDSDLGVEAGESGTATATAA